MRRWLLLAAVTCLGSLGAGLALTVAAPECRTLWPLRRVAVRVYRAVQGREVRQPDATGPIPVTAAELEAGRAAIHRAIEDSRTRARFHIVVDKTAYSLFVYLDGELVRSYPVELGFDPGPPKRRKGDGRTPEGRYTVTWRRDLGQTRFHRALLLDYPNERDRRAGRTGGDIEIHGRGSGARPGEGGVNWTLGCIALSDDDIDDLFSLRSRGRAIAVGTPVTIVRCGSLPDERYRLTR